METSILMIFITPLCLYSGETPDPHIKPLTSHTTNTGIPIATSEYNQENNVYSLEVFRPVVFQ